MIQGDYGIRLKRITKRNPQANSIVERVHQTIGNMLRTFRVHDMDVMDEEDPWSSILAAISYGVRATVSTTTRASPMQLVFGRDPMLDVKYAADWKYIRDRKQKVINDNNRKENAKRLDHMYSVGDEILIKAERNSKYGADAYYGPFAITQINDNGTVCVQEGHVEDTYNIRNITPYIRP